MLTLETKADLEKLITDSITESLTLDYKASPALGKDSKQRDELCKDVSAFANSAGGQIVYGVEEDKTFPTKVDDGADPSITKEWIEQILDSRIQPRIEGLIIKPIQLANGFGFVVTIPQATCRAPHQAPDKRYYKRQNFQSVAMEDYEIRDVLRRATTPVLQVTLSLGKQNSTLLEFERNERKARVKLDARITNKSPQPAYHSTIYIGLDGNLGSLNSAMFSVSRPPTNHTNDKHWFSRRLTSPPEPPLFLEGTPEPIPLHFSVDASFTQSAHFDITTVIETPGYASAEHWVIECTRSRLTLYGPNDPKWAPENK